MKYKILVKQHIGAPCAPTVKAGDKVERGMLIAEPTGLGAAIFSPFNGKVADVDENAIYIEAKEADQPKEDKYIPLEGETPADLIKAAGLVGMGGAGFPTAVKCNVDLHGGYILVNAAECEPLLEHNIGYLAKHADKLIEGVKILKKLCNASHGVFAIKAKHEEEVKTLAALCEKEDNISVHLLPDIYPMGEERAVVREVLGKLLEPTDLPSKADAVVINVETVQRVAEAVIDKRPVMTKNVSVAGKLKGGTHTRVFYDVPLGTTVGELIERAGGIDGEYGEIVMGGPFTGKPTTLDAPITKTTGGIIVTKPFEDLKGAKVGLLLCACGGNEARMRDIAEKMNGVVECVQTCKQAADIKGTLKCENPGNCPGQAQKCMNIKKAGCTDILIGNCSDCTNTVMGSAPKLGLNVHHQTDTIFDTVGKERMRYLTTSKSVPQLGEQTEEEAAALENCVYEVTQNVEDGMLHIDIKSGKNIEIELPLFQ
jgi:proline reductase-associated electron transfer protein PrdC